MLAGPGLRALSDHVKDRLNSDAFSHFRADGGPSRPSGPAAAADRPTSLTGALVQQLGPAGGQLQLVPAGQGLGNQIIANVAQQRAASPAADPRTNMGRSFGLGRRGA